MLMLTILAILSGIIAAGVAVMSHTYNKEQSRLTGAGVFTLILFVVSGGLIIAASVTATLAITAKDQDKAAVQAGASATNDALTQARSDLQAATTNSSHLQQGLDAANALADDLRDKLDDAINQADKAAAELLASIKARDELAAFTEQAKSELQSIRKHRDELNKLNESAQEHAAALEAKLANTVASLGGELDKHKAKAESLTQELGAAKAQVATLQQNAEAGLTTGKEELLAARQEALTRSQELAAAGNKLQEQQRQLITTQAELAATKQQLKATQASLDVALKQVETLTKVDQAGDQLRGLLNPLGTPTGETE